jgi:hypothetical protein
MGWIFIYCIAYLRPTVMEQKEETTPEKEPIKKDNLEKILDFLKDPSSKDTQKVLVSFLKNVVPHPIYKIAGDVVIGGTCFGAIIFCAHMGYVEKSNVQSLLALVVGAIVGARFKAG